MLPKSGLTSFRFGVAVTGIANLVVAGLTVIATRIYANRYGNDALSSMLLFRIAGSVLLAIAGMGMPISIQRNVAYLSSTPQRASTLTAVGLTIATLGSGLICLTGYFLAPQIVRVSGYPSAGVLWQGFVALSFAQYLSSLISIIQTARGKITQAALNTVAGFGLAVIIPLVIFPHRSLAEVTFWSALFSLVLAIPSLIDIGRWVVGNGFGDARREVVTLLKYGLPRVAASIIEPSLDLILSGIALVTVSGLQSAGGIAVGLALLRPFNPLIGALSYVLIPASASLAADGNQNAQSRRMRQMVEWSAHLGVFATVHLFVWSDLLLSLWLGNTWATGNTASLEVARIICLSFAASFMYGTLRGMIDGENERPVNTINLIVSLLALFALTGVVWLFGLGTWALGVSYLVSRSVLVLLTLRYAFSTHGLSFGQLSLARPALISCALAAVELGLKAMTPGSGRWYLFIAANVFAGLIYVAWLAAGNISWARFITDRLGATHTRLEVRS